MQAGFVTGLDWERLREAGEFDPAYLHLRKEAVLSVYRSLLMQVILRACKHSRSFGSL